MSNIIMKWKDVSFPSLSKRYGAIVIESFYFISRHIYLYILLGFTLGSDIASS